MEAAPGRRNGECPAMAMISLLFLVLSFAALFVSGTVHAAAGAAFLLAAFVHNWSSRGFYSKAASGQGTGRKAGDLVLIVLLGVSCVLLAASGIVILLVAGGSASPALFVPAISAHRVCAAAMAVLAVLHMKQEWS